MLPNFLICGTSHGGTSFLLSALLQHPEVYMPKEMRPEPHYFYYSWRFRRPISWYESTWFSNVKDEKAIGEKSTSYMFGKRVAKNIAQYLPNIKLIFMLRNPMERTYTNYRFTVLGGLEELSFEDALKCEEDRVKKQQGIWAEVQPYSYTGRSFYFEQIERFLKIFDRQQILIRKSEDMFMNPQGTFEKVFRFLGVDETFTPIKPPKFGSPSVKNRHLQVELRRYFGDVFDRVIDMIRQEKDPSHVLRTEEDREMFDRLKDNLKDTKEDMPAESRIYLQRLFEKDMNHLRKIVDFSIDDWR
jgi:hypothetical protein